MLPKVVLLAAMAFAGASSGGAEYRPRPVTGIVTDKRGNTLPGAIVQIENTRNLSVRSYLTHKDGRYRFNGLDDDIDYTLRAHYRNYWSKSKTLSKFNSSRHPEIDLVIPID